jgi:hypothetical protein
MTTSAFFIVVYVAATRDLDRTLGLRGDSMRDRSQQRALRPSVTVRADDDQVRAPSLGLLDDGVLGRIYLISSRISLSIFGRPTGAFDFQRQ